VKAKTRRTVRALAGQRLVIEGFGRRAPALIVISGVDVPASAWLSPVALRQLVAAVQRILK
jgi:hypothetical protein